MAPRQSEAIKLIESLSGAELNQLAVGHRDMIYRDGRFELVEPSERNTHVLFSGGEEWLDDRVPNEDRHGEALRRYIIGYIEEVFDYITARW